MEEKIKEADVVLSKCKASHRLFGMRVERRKDDHWYFTWAFALSEKGAAHEGYGNKMLSGNFYFDKEYPGCPYCGGGGYVSCGKCGKLTCFSNEDKDFKCAWCGNSGEVTEAESFELTGGGY